MGMPLEKKQDKRPAREPLSKVDDGVNEYPKGQWPGGGAQSFDGRENKQAGTSFADRETPFVAYWKTPARVLRQTEGSA